MATRKTSTTQDTEKEAVQPEEEPKVEPKATGSNMIKVYNPQRYFYRQPSTGIRVESKKVSEIRDDNWADLQIKAGILNKAK